MNSGVKYIASVDMGGTKILTAIIDSNNKILCRVKKSTKALSGSRGVIRRMIESIELAIETVGIPKDKLAGIIVGVPGSLNPKTGIVYLAPNLGWKNTNVVRPIQRYFDIPTIIENDANLGTLGIYEFGLGVKPVNMVAIFVGTGIGSGIIINKKLFRGNNFSAGEIGHIILEEGGHLCGCGNHGCFETVASRTAIAREINQAIKLGKKSIIKEFVSNSNMIKSGALASAVAKNDKLTKKVLQFASRKIGLVIANISNLLNIECFVLAGGVIEAVGDFVCQS